VRRGAAGFVIFCLVAMAAPALTPAAVPVPDPGAPWPRLELQMLPPPPPEAVEAPVQLVPADLDGDGTRDLLAVWSSGNTTVAAWYPAPRWRQVVRGAAPFRTCRTILVSKRTVAFAAVCDVDRDGHADVLLADRRTPELLWTPATGDGTGAFHRIPLPGTVTALAALDWGRRDTLREPVVGVATPAGPALALVVPDQTDPSRGPAAVLAMPGTVRRIVAGRFDSDGWRDLAVGTDAGLVLVHGVDTAAPKRFEPPRAEPQRLVGEAVLELAAAHFLRRAHHDLPVLTADGLRLFDPSDRSLRTPAGTLPAGKTGAASFALAWEGVGRGPAVVVPRPGGLELLGDISLGGETSWTARLSAFLDLGAEPLVMAPMTRTVDGLDDIVLAFGGDPRPRVLLSRSRSTWTVTTDDDHDDGICAVADCSLREAIEATNASAGPDTITTNGPLSFSIGSPLPIVEGTTTFDFKGSSWTISGSQTTGTWGLRITGDSCVVDYLVATNHTIDHQGLGGVGVLLFGTENTRLHGLQTRNNTMGIEFFDAIDCTVEDGVATANNTGNGAEVYRGLNGSTSGNTLAISAIENGGNGIRILNAVDTTIGDSGTRGYDANDNTGSGILVEGSQASGTVILGYDVRSNGTTGAEDAGVKLNGCGSVTMGLVIPGGGGAVQLNHGDGILVRETVGPINIANYRIGAQHNVSWGNRRDGILVDRASDVTIRRSTISDNGLNGIEAKGGANAPVSNLSILSCTIGPGYEIGNGSWGIYLEGVSSSTVDGNTVLYNPAGGIAIVGSDSTSNVLTDNLVGVSSSGTIYGNGGTGILIDDAVANRIGPGNTVTYTTSDTGLGVGILVTGNGAASNDLSGNSIYANAGLGIDLGGDGVTLPDEGDTDEGPNHLMNQPLIYFAESCDDTTWIYGRLRAAASPFSLTLSFYSNDQCDATGEGEGKTPIGYDRSLRAPDGGTVAFRHEVPLDLGGLQITSMTTGPFGSSSEFSNCVAVRSGRPGDVTADCRLMADDLAGLDHAVTDPTYGPPGDPDVNGDGETDTTDLLLTVLKIFW